MSDDLRPLFPTDSLDGWALVRDQPPSAWSVKDGVVTCSGEGRGWLRTERMYREFHLSLEYALSQGGNSGVFLRSLTEGRPAYNGMEIQLLDDQGHPPGVKSTGAIYDAIAPSKVLARPAMEWNYLEAICQGDSVQVSVNRELVIDVDLTEHEALKDRPREGYIGLQNHGSLVLFRNVRVRQL